MRQSAVVQCTSSLNDSFPGLRLTETNPLPTLAAPLLVVRAGDEPIYYWLGKQTWALRDLLKMLYA